MTREEIEQIHNELRQSNDGIFILKNLAANYFLFTIEKTAIEQIAANDEAMNILAKELRLLDQSPDKLKLPLDVEL